jgi:hypothetical protein
LAQCFRWPLNWSNTKSLFPPNALTPRQHLISASLYPIDNLVPLDLLTSTHFYFQYIPIWADWSLSILFNITYCSHTEYKTLCWMVVHAQGNKPMNKIP